LDLTPPQNVNDDAAGSRPDDRFAGEGDRQLAALACHSLVAVAMVSDEAWPRRERSGPGQPAAAAFASHKIVTNGVSSIP
jgi:hypothetical protein